MPIITPKEKRLEAAAKMRKYLDKQYANHPGLKEKVEAINAKMKKIKKPSRYIPPVEIVSLEQWEEYQKWEDRVHADYQIDSLIGELDAMLNAKKGHAIEQPLNYNHTNPFDELDKSLGNKTDGTSSKDTKQNRFKHLEISTDVTDEDREGNGGDSTQQPKEG